MRWHTKCPARFGIKIRAVFVSALSGRGLSVPTDQDDDDEHEES
jgi:hypothetical protein